MEFYHYLTILINVYALLLIAVNSINIKPVLQ